jgi:hypothetical protein
MMADGYPLIVLVKGFDFSPAMFTIASLQCAFDGNDDFTLLIDLGLQYSHIRQIKRYCYHCWLWLIRAAIEIKVHRGHF